MLNQKEFSDITLMVQGKPIYCHQVILASRSVYFEAQFSHDFSEKDTRVATYNDVPYDYFIMFLKHIYSDNVKVETKYVYELLSVSSTFDLSIFSWPTGSVSRVSRRSVSKYWPSTSQSTQSARYSSTRTNSTANVFRKHAYSL